MTAKGGPGFDALTPYGSYLTPIAPETSRAAYQSASTGGNYHVTLVTPEDEKTKKFAPRFRNLFQ